jgi:hypothetical protein
MIALARSRGGKCLSPVYIPMVKLRWRCHAGHEWEAQPIQVKHRSWCPKCAYRYRGTIDGMRAPAVDRGGRCLSDRYEGHATEVVFECEKRRKFKMAGGR